MKEFLNFKKDLRVTCCYRKVVTSVTSLVAVGSIVKRAMQKRDDCGDMAPESLDFLRESQY